MGVFTDHHCRHTFPITDLVVNKSVELNPLTVFTSFIFPALCEADRLALNQGCFIEHYYFIVMDNVLFVYLVLAGNSGTFCH